MEDETTSSKVVLDRHRCVHTDDDDDGSDLIQARKVDPRQGLARPLMTLTTPCTTFGRSIIDVHQPRPVLTFTTAIASSPHPAKVCGEDAYFISNDDRGCCYFGVADGVGSWFEQGVDPRDVRLGSGVRKMAMMVMSLRALVCPSPDARGTVCGHVTDDIRV